MPRFIPILFLLLPLVEIALFIKVGQWIGLWPTLGLIVVAGLLGVALLRQQGLSVLSRMRSSMADGRLPAGQVADAVMIGVAAVLLILPGFLSDVAALLLLIPQVRGWIKKAFVARGGVANVYEQRRVDVIDLDDDEYRGR